MNIQSVSMQLGGKTLTLETGKMAKQADASIYVSYGDTRVLVTACSAKDPKPGIDFMPLTVEYAERFYAAGKIPGSFPKREGRPTTEATLAARMIDRPNRPLFPEGYHHDTQVIATIMSLDHEGDAEVAASIGAGAALHISNIPFNGPTAMVKMGRIGGQFVVNPSWKQLQEESDMEIVVSGTKNAIMMVEGMAKEVPEADVLDAIIKGHEEIKKICSLIEDLRKKAGVEKRTFTPKENNADLIKKVEAQATELLKKSLKTKEKQERYKLAGEAKEKTLAALVPAALKDTDPKAYEAQAGEVKRYFELVQFNLMREMILTDKIRIDGRDSKTIRNITVEAGLLPKVHGSSLFTRTAAAGLSYQWLSSPDGLTWNPIPTATTIATTQSVTGTTYYQCAVACGTDVATSSTLTVNFGLAPNAGVTAATSTMVCPNQPINLSLTGASTAPGLTYQWQSSANGVTYSPIVPTASLAATTQTITSSIYFQNVITCGSATAASTPIQVMTAGTTTNNVPYFEGFEGISFNNQLPNCSWTATSPGTICLTYTATPPPTVYNRIPKSGSKFGSFRYGTATAGDYFYTNGIQLTAGVLYQASADYITDGASGWSEFSLLYGTSQSTTGLTSIASATGALTNTTYSNLSGTFSVSATGLYHIAVKAIGNNTPWYLTFDDLKVDVAPSCLAPTAFASTGFTSSSATFSWTAGGTETSWDVFVGSTPNGTTVPTATTTTTSYTATGLSVGNTYSVYVRANCGGTNSAWVLSTVVINYCTPAPSSVDGSGITNVTIPTGINNTTTAEVGNYGNYSVQTATVFQGANVPVSITYATGYTYDTKIWIDFNDDLDFNDVGEDIYTGVSLATNPTTLIANITIPLAAPMGVHRLRIGGVDVGPPTPCYNGTYGSFEDYSINIQAAPACTLAPVAGVISGSTTVNNGTTNSYSISPVSGNVQWYTGTTATGPWSPIATATAATNQTITAVGSGTVYYTVIASAPGCVNDTANVAYPVTVIFQGDNVCNAIPLSIGTSPLYDLFGATTQTGEVVPPGTGNTTNSGWLNSNLTNSMWFTFVAPLSGNVSIQAPTSMNGGANDPQLAVWSTTNCANLIGQATPTAPVGATLVAANDDDANYTTNAGAQYSSYVRAACLTPGTTYYIQLDTYSAASPGDATTIIITDLGAYNASFSGLLSNYCLPAASSSLTPANAGGVFTVNGGTTTVTSFTPTTLGTNTVTYTNQLVACVTTSTTIVANTPTVGATASSASVCAGASATLTAAGATNYTWTAGGNASTEVVTPSSASVYTVTGEDLGCSNTATVSVGITSTPTVMAMTSNTAICAGSSATLTASGATNYTWTAGGNASTEVVTPTGNATYTVTGEDLGCSSTATVSVNVNAIPVVSATASQTLLCDDGSTGASVLTASTSASTYSWSDGATTMTTAVTPTSTTTYTVTVTELGCSADAFVTVTVSNCNGVKELVANGISIYPNPTNGILNIAISSELAGNTSVEVYDAVGKLVIKETLSTETNTINTSKLTDGIYVFKIMNNNQAIKIGKIVKQ